METGAGSLDTSVGMEEVHEIPSKIMEVKDGDEYKVHLGSVESIREDMFTDEVGCNKRGSVEIVGACEIHVNKEEIETVTTMEVEGSGVGGELEVNSNIASEVGNLETFRSDNLDDPADWPSQQTMTGSIRDFLIVQGPKNGKLINNIYPKDNSKQKRSFSNVHFIRQLQNGEFCQRRWLLYSHKKKSMFCFCCKIFGNATDLKSLYDENGNNNWHNTSKILKRHECSALHMTHYMQWIEAEKRLKSKKAIDMEHQKIINREASYWGKILERLLAIVQYLAEHNLSFRGSNEKLFQSGNGNFLGLVQLFGKFDAITNEHIRRITSNETRTVSYVGKMIQNELIQLLGDNIKKTILAHLKEAKYFSFILDCTPDISHQEQLSLVVRFVDLSQKSHVTLSERFLGFILAEDCTGKGLTETILKEIESLGIPLANCRGQGYDNGANMKGKHSGLQRHILDKNPRAYFVPCGCHSLNLVLSDAAKSSVDTISLFGIVQRVYVLFSASVNRWRIFTSNVSGLTVKPLSATRWESRIDAVKVFRYQISAVRDALLALANDRVQADDARSEAQSLVSAIEDWKFLISIVTWYDILFKINITSKEMQNKTADISLVVNLLESNKKFLTNYRENCNGYTDAKIIAKELAEELEIEPDFKAQRIRKKKKMFDYEQNDEGPEDLDSSFRTKFFIPLIDVAIQSVNERFAQLSEHCKNWEIIYSIITRTNCTDRINLLKKCMDFQLTLTHESVSDVNGHELCDEILSLKDLLPSEISSPKSVLDFIVSNSLQDLFPNIWVTLRIFLTTPVSVASAERSFSKLKLIKTYLRSTMTQDRLSSLAIISIENDLLSDADTSELISKFAKKKARKVVI